ncbi:MAG: hypothetical protein HUU57_13950 [Bdellovibrio sp.]|nr:hypothetical protein [Bdellovibrio sp.]
MMKTNLFLILFFLLSGCTSKLIIQSTPQQADIYVAIEGKADRVKLGQTPMEITETQLAEMLKITPESSQWIEFTFEKKDFLTRNMMLPSNRWGEATKTLKVNLSPAPEQTTIVRKMINYFFNAKKFAESKQFEQAHSEIDKILEIDSKSSQAMTMKAGIFFLQGRLDESKKLYTEALALDPSSTDAIQMLEKIQNKRGQ